MILPDYWLSRPTTHVDPSAQPAFDRLFEAHDFPFLAQIRGHDDERLQEYATAMQTGGSWPDPPVGNG